MVGLEGRENSLKLFFVVGLFLLIFFSVTTKNIFYIWIFIEIVFFLVILLIVKKSKRGVSLNGVIIYLFVQALRRILLLSSIIVEIFYFGNYYYLGSNICSGCLYLRVMGLILKIRMFPFYLQVYQIIGLIGYDQILLFILYPKIVPSVILYSIVGQLDLGGGVLVFPLLVVFISRVQRLKSSDVREFLAWSRLRQLGWIFVSLLRSFVFFCLFFYLYSFVLMYTCSLLKGSGSKIFCEYSRVGGDSQGLYRILFLVFFMSRLAPFIIFYIKLLLLYGVRKFFPGFLVVLLVRSIRIFIFYLRIIQMVMCEGTSFRYYESPSQIRFRNYLSFFTFFLFLFRGFFMLV